MENFGIQVIPIGFIAQDEAMISGAPDVATRRWVEPLR
jgi:hypothetical protein